MMPPPTINMRLGLRSNFSAPVLVTTLGSSFGKKGNFTASEPAAMTARLKRSMRTLPSGKVTLR